MVKNAKRDIKITIALSLLIIINYDNIIPGREILLFVRDGCSGCIAVKQFAQELNNEGFNISIIADPEIHKKYNINAVPTVLIIVGKTEIKRKEYVFTGKEEFRRYISTN